LELTGWAELPVWQPKIPLLAGKLIAKAIYENG
jgi:hypothetical protein